MRSWSEGLKTTDSVIFLQDRHTAFYCIKLTQGNKELIIVTVVVQ